LYDPDVSESGSRAAEASYTPIPPKLVGATALVTGGSSGIGAEVARQLVRSGANVAVVGRDATRLAEIVAYDGGAGAKIHTIEAELLDDAAWPAIAARTNDLFPVLDIVVHAAGIFIPQPFEETTQEDLTQSLAVNLIGPFMLTQALMTQLRSGSTIIFVSSVAGHVGLTREAAYSASKAGIEGLTRALAVELADRRIRVNCVAPGFTATPMNEAFRQKDSSIVSRAQQATLAGRLGRPEDIAAAVVFLASPAASFIWGTVLSVDGGYPVSPVQVARQW
jgi:NAD(P)-dependent dehydrogenase (short-subunit alcohol dehydrogenase family)